MAALAKIPRSSPAGTLADFEDRSKKPTRECDSVSFCTDAMIAASVDWRREIITYPSDSLHFVQDLGCLSGFSLVKLH